MVCPVDRQQQRRPVGLPLSGLQMELSIDSCGRRAAGAGAQQQMRAASRWQQTEEAGHSDNRWLFCLKPQSYSRYGIPKAMHQFPGCIYFTAVTSSNCSTAVDRYAAALSRKLFLYSWLAFYAFALVHTARQLKHNRPRTRRAMLIVHSYSE